MFVIFGFGHTKVKKVGETKPGKCAHCNNVNKFDIVERSKWFTLFFLPVFPYSKEKAIVCPVCKSGRKLEQNEDKSMASEQESKIDSQVEHFNRREQQLKTQLDKGEIDVNEYKKKMNLLKFDRSSSISK